MFKLARMPPIRSAGCLIIGDEVLNGKILDTNLYEFAKYCFSELSIPLKKTVVCGDDKDDIIRSLQVLRDEKCDFIITSGGIGSTHDDITYGALSEAFEVPCALDQTTVDRMNNLRGKYLLLLTKPQLHAFYKMATLPQSTAEVDVLKLFVKDSLWVPIVGINSQVYVLPGVPQLFKQLLLGLGDAIKTRVVQNKFQRYYVNTTSGESTMAPFLTDLQNRCDAKYGVQQIKVGLYPHFNWGLVTISIIGDDSIPQNELREVVEEVVASIGGGAKEISAEEEHHITSEEPPEEK